MAAVQNMEQLTHIKAREKTSKKDVPKGTEGEKMGKREGTEIRLTTEKSFLFPSEDGRR